MRSSLVAMCWMMCLIHARCSVCCLLRFGRLSPAFRALGPILQLPVLSLMLLRACTVLSQLSAMLHASL